MKTSALALGALVCLAPSLLAVPITYRGGLSGANEVPTVVSPGTGQALVTIDTTAHTLAINVTFSGLTSVSTASHIHCCASPSAGVATTTPTFAGFPLGVTSGTYANILDLTQSTSWNPAFITANGGTTAGAEAALASGLASGLAYLNVHSANFPGGELRANLVPVPEPRSLGMMAAGIVALAAIRRRRRS